jgi:hypothetical protein
LRVLWDQEEFYRELLNQTGSFQGGFGSSLMLKDLGLAQDAANRTGSATPLGSLSLQVNIEIDCTKWYMFQFYIRFFALVLTLLIMVLGSSVPRKF